MRHGSLFSGIGGFDLAAEWMGWENVFHCEWNEFGQRVLKYYWPKSISYADITKTDFSIHRGTIDILTGGFPCQPYSQAGKRRGKADERHLWPEMLRAIGEIQPSWIVGENVRGIVNWNGGMVFNEVQSDLEAAGYNVFPYVLPAAGVDAPHERYRVWFIAHAKRNNDSKTERRGDGEKEGISPEYRKDYDFAGEFSGATLQHEQREQQSEHTIADTNCNGQYGSDRKDEVLSGERREHAQCDIISGPFDGDTANTDSERLSERFPAGEPSVRIEKGTFAGCEFARAYTKGDWRQFPTQPPLCAGDDGISTRLDGITFSKWRNESIKAGGNAVVPQVVFKIFKAIEQYEQL